jgi:hypothetical protein
VALHGEVVDDCYRDHSRPPGDNGSPGAGPPGPLHRGRWLLLSFSALLTVAAPPQAGVFTLVESLANYGAEPVRIEAVSILSPQQQANAADGTPAFPVAPAGAVRWRLEDSGFGQTGPVSGNPVAGHSLAPGQPIVVAIPLRQSGRCDDPDGWEQVNAFYVEERFGPFTQWVGIPLAAPLLLHTPSNPGNPEPARDLVCPGGAAK